MKVWLDHKIFTIQRYGGVSRYFVELLRALHCIDGIKADIFAPAHINEYLQASDLSNPFTFRMRMPKRGVGYRPAMVAPFFRLAAEFGKPDLVHETHYSHGHGHLPYHQPLITTCHDMIFEKFTGLFPDGHHRIELKRISLERADAIICISENTRNDLLDYYPKFESKVTVVHHGVDHTLAPDCLPIILPEPYFLFVGIRSGYKNFSNLVRAMGSSRYLCKNFNLLCFGGGVFDADELNFCKTVGYPVNRLHHIHGGDSLLAYTYKKAFAFVSPSGYEGFGMPLTEAMVQGSPIACSSASCYPEICAGAAAYFNPDDVESMRDCLEKMTDDNTRAQLTTASRVRAKQYSWMKCAEQTTSAYRDVL